MEMPRASVELKSVKKDAGSVQTGWTMQVNQFNRSGGFLCKVAAYAG